MAWARGHAAEEGRDFLNSAFAFAQEVYAERAVDALAEYIPQRARVLRDGSPGEVDAAELVPGEIVVIEAGDRIAADIRLLLGAIEVDMSALTGASVPALRSASILDVDVPVLRAHDLVFSGTSCTGGEARGVVFATAGSADLGGVEQSQYAAQGLLAGDAEAAGEHVEGQFEGAAGHPTVAARAAGASTGKPTVTVTHQGAVTLVTASGEDIARVADTAQGILAAVVVPQGVELIRMSADGTRELGRASIGSLTGVDGMAAAGSTEVLTHDTTVATVDLTDSTVRSFSLPGTLLDAG